MASLPAGVGPDALVRRGDVLWRSAPGFLALCTVDGRVTTVSGSADVIWALLDSPASMGALVTAVADVYDVAPEVVSADIGATIESLRALGCVHVDH